MKHKIEMNKAIELFKGGEHQDALKKLEKLEKENQNDLDIKFNYALMLGFNGMYAHEQQKYKEIISKQPNDYGAYINLAVSLNETKQYSEAIKYSSEAIKINPNIAEGYESRAIAKQFIDQIDEANLDLKKWLELEIKDKNTKYTNILKECLELNKIPAIYENEQQIEEVRTYLEQKAPKVLEKLKKIPQNFLKKNDIGKKIAFKLNRFYLAYQQKNDKQLNQIYNQIKTILIGQLNTVKPENGNKKKKLGVISTFKYHPEIFIIDQLKLVDKDIQVILLIINNSQIKIDNLSENFKIVHLRINPSNIGSEIENIIEQAFDIVFMPDIGMSIESQILSAYKLAPISLMSWLHPVTSGSRNINYFLSGELMETQESELEYTEKLIKLPGIGIKINQEKYIIDNEIKDQNKLNECMTIGCLQTPFKYHPKYDHVLVAVAKRIKNVKFIFIKYQSELDEKLIKRIKHQFEKNKLNPNNIIIQDRQEREKYRIFLKTLDISIDSLGWSGGNTTLDCLGAGIPVLTIKNKLMRSNHTAGIYKIIEMDELILKTTEELVEKVYELSKNREELNRLKNKISNNFRNINTDYEISKFINEIAYQK